MRSPQGQGTLLRHVLLLLVMVMVTASSWADAERIATLRQSAIAIENEPSRMPATENTDRRRTRNYPMQPPVIPHAIDNYEVNLNANKCLSCHDRKLTGESQAPMISVTHFMNRDGNFLAAVSPRRYFCNQCHVPQLDATPLVGNAFRDVDSLLSTTD